MVVATPVYTFENLSLNAQAIWCKRYASRLGKVEFCYHCKDRHETMEHFLNRVSFRRQEFKDLINSLAFLPNSPTLFNAGIPNAGSLSACFVLEVPDTMDGILDIAKHSGMIQKYGGGIGYYLSDLRPKGADIRSTHGKACGPVATLCLYNSVASLVTQGGKRAGAQMAVLDASHPDIRGFIHCKDENPQGLSTFNVSVRVGNDWMYEAVHNEHSDAGKLLWEIAESCWRTGDPGMIFGDTVDAHCTDPWMGKWRGCNPCGEQFLPNFGSCNLGSINLMSIVDGDTVNLTRLREITDLAVKYLDVVVNENNYPIPEIADLARERRNIGLGVMGLADMLDVLHLPYDSAAALTTAKGVWRAIRAQANETSAELASMWGHAPAYNRKGATGPARRNTTLLSVAPTGTISILAGVSSGIEPHYALANTRVTGDGMVLNEAVHTNGFRPKTAMEVPWKHHIEMASVFHRWSDTGVSKTVNLPNDATVTDMREAYIYAWRMKLMAVSLFRDGCRGEQVLNSDVCPECGKVTMVRQDGCSTCQTCGHSYCEVA